MTITTFAIIAIITIIFGWISWIICASIKHFSAMISGSERVLFRGNFTYPAEAIKTFEPIKSHIDAMNEAKRTHEALKDAIIRNLLDNGYVPTLKHFDRLYIDHPEILKLSVHSFNLPDLIELQNVIKLQPIIKDLEEQYKRYDEAKKQESVEFGWVTIMISSVRINLNTDNIFKLLVSAKGIDNYYDLYRLILSPEAKEIVERAINKALKEAKESKAKESKAKESKAKESKAKESKAKES